MFEEGISGREVSANPSSSPLPSPAVFLSPELELLASTLRALEGLAEQEVLFSLRRLRLALLEREYQSRESHGAQNSRCEPNSIAIESADRVPFHWRSLAVWRRDF
jgi:hypothetical protein